MAQVVNAGAKARQQYCFINSVIVLCDNAGFTANVENPTASSYVKNTDVAYHMCRNQVAVGYTEPEFARTADKVVDMFTISTVSKVCQA
jgi:hypothetical protein